MIQVAFFQPDSNELTEPDNTPADITGVTYPKLYANKNDAPSTGFPDEPMTAINDANTGDEQGEAMNADEIPNRNGSVNVDNSDRFFFSEFDDIPPNKLEKSGKLNSTISNKFKPINIVKPI